LLEKEVQPMHTAIVEFQYGNDFDPAHLADIAGEERGRFEGLPGLRLKTFAIDEENRRATNVYLWESEDAARGFFSDEVVDMVTGRYGVAPTVTYAEVAELIDNG
jgi:hypothetical protein